MHRLNGRLSGIGHRVGVDQPLYLSNGDFARPTEQYPDETIPVTFRRTFRDDPAHPRSLDYIITIL